VAQTEKPFDPKAPEQYHLWYYNTKVWEKTTFMGVRCLKSVSDMWNYQEIIFELKPSLIVEFGAYKGGATLFFSEILKWINPNSKVLTVDNMSPNKYNEHVRNNPHIEIFTSSSADPKVADKIVELRKQFPGPVFAILDSDHHKNHVLAEMKMLRNLLEHGDYVVVEDSNTNGHPIDTDFGDGPMEAILEYEKELPDDYTHDTQRENKFGFTFAPHGFLIRKRPLLDRILGRS